MRQTAVELTNRSADIHVLMHPAFIVARGLPEKTHGLVALPAAMLHFAAEKEVAPTNAIRVELFRFNRVCDVERQRRRALLVRIDDKDPFVARGLDRRVSLSADRREWVIDDARARG